MDSSLIFYLSRKTSYNETALISALGGTGITLKNTSFARSAHELGKKLDSAIKNTRLVFICGGIAVDKDFEITNVFSYAFENANTSPEEIKKLKCPDGRDGYVFKKGGCCVILLPDDPVEIASLVTGQLAGYIMEHAKAN